MLGRTKKKKYPTYDDRNNHSHVREVVVNTCQDENRIGEHKGRRIKTLETSTFDLHLETRDVKVAIRLTFSHGVTSCLEARNIMVVLEMSDMSKLSDSHSNAKEVLPTIDARNVKVWMCQNSLSSSHLHKKEVVDTSEFWKCHI